MQTRGKQKLQREGSLLTRKDTHSPQHPNLKFKKCLQCSRSLRALAIDNCRPPLFVFGLANVHFMKRSETAQNGTSNPGQNRTLRHVWSQQFDPPIGSMLVNQSFNGLLDEIGGRHIGWSQAGAAPAQDNVRQQGGLLFSVTLVDGIACHAGHWTGRQQLLVYGLQVRLTGSLQFHIGFASGRQGGFFGSTTLGGTATDNARRFIGKGLGLILVHFLRCLLHVTANGVLGRFQNVFVFGILAVQEIGGGKALGTGKIHHSAIGQFKGHRRSVKIRSRCIDADPGACQPAFTGQMEARGSVDAFLALLVSEGLVQTLDRFDILLSFLFGVQLVERFENAIVHLKKGGSGIAQHGGRGTETVKDGRDGCPRVAHINDRGTSAATPITTQYRILGHENCRRL